jgi:hypothetical protein
MVMVIADCVLAWSKTEALCAFSNAQLCVVIEQQLIEQTAPQFLGMELKLKARWFPE